jgi:hypothetical protein
MASSHLEALQQLAEALQKNVALTKRVAELEAELKVRPSSAHGVEKYMAEGANTRRPGVDTGAQSINRGGFENDLEENPVQVNYEVPHR